MSVASNADLAGNAPPVAESRMAAAVSDLVLGLAQWRIWWILGLSDIRQRYRRSTLGQFWLTISMAAMIFGIGLVYSLIFDQQRSAYVPFLGVGIIVWGLLSSLINHLAICFISAETYLRSYPGPRSVVIYRTIARELIVSAHNFLIVPLILIAFMVPISITALLVLPALMLIVLNAVWIGMLLGTVCTRFRDLPQITASVVQLIFFLTPILWRPEQLQDRLWWITHLNPFASFVDIVRAPILGEVPDLHHYLLVLLCTLVGWAVALPFYARFRGRIVYWL